MSQETSKNLRKSVAEAKDFDERKYSVLTDNFYILKSALRYFSVKQGLSFTSSKISDNFPVSVPVAGSSLNILEELGVVESRTRSSAPDRYMPQEVDLERMEEIENILIENYEIKKFKDRKDE